MTRMRRPSRHCIESHAPIWRAKSGCFAKRPGFGRHKVGVRVRLSRNRLAASPRRCTLPATSTGRVENRFDRRDWCGGLFAGPSSGPPPGTKTRHKTKTRHQTKTRKAGALRVLMSIRACRDYSLAVILTFRVLVRSAGLPMAAPMICGTGSGCAGADETSMLFGSSR